MRPTLWGLAEGREVGKVREVREVREVWEASPVSMGGRRSFIGVGSVTGLSGSGQTFIDFVPV